ncbi:helix-turn-helix domain-containing protein [Streptococcus suis]|uniref:helix-turn-helix domain-containing protein n=1 Tax=Streptococcus suis TaxID=1307 RepID=UPI0003FE154A|nr:helix-turn-helix transcriptional regulator [Streptococcus suis]
MNNTIMVGLRIQSIRKKLGETMETFGERFQVGKGTVNNWEKGRSIPKKPTLLKISQAGNISIDELLYGSKEEYIDYLFSIKLDEILSEYEKIDKKQLNKVIFEEKDLLLKKDLTNWSYNRILKNIDKIFKKITTKIPTDTDDMLLEIIHTLNSDITWVRGLYGGKGLVKKGTIKNNNLNPVYYDEVMSILTEARGKISKLRDKLEDDELNSLDF